MTWIDRAICSNDKNPARWLSFDLKDIEYAKDGCNKCPVKKQCIMSSVNGDGLVVGVIAGLSEFDRLMMDWEESKVLDDDNWK